MSAATVIAAWAAELDAFPEEIARTLHEWVLRLESAIGPSHTSSSSARGTLDGFDGITHRGSYERLLLSEWLLADELPDEFLRRASTSEHSFLRLAERTPHAARESIVLVDAGPWQLGSPRLAHLALLLALHRRASKSRSKFAWGVLQAGAGPLFETVDSHSVPALLSARTLTAPTTEMLLTWRNRLDAAGTIAEVWLIGAPQLGRVADLGPRLGVRTERAIIDQAIGVLEVEIGSDRARRVALTLPEPAVITRMLRDPFAGERRARRVRLDVPTEHVVVSACGRKAFARFDGGLVSFPIPNSPAAKPGRPRRHYVGGLLMAAALHRGTPMVLSADLATRRLFLQRVGADQQQVGHFTEEQLVHAPWKPERGDPLSLLHVTENRAELRAYYVDARDRLFELQPRGNVARLLAREVLAVTALRNGIAVVARAFSKTWVQGAPDGPALMTLIEGEWEPPEPLTGEIVSAKLGSFVTSTGPRCISAMLTPAGDWNVHGCGRPYSVRHPDGAHVVGLRHADKSQPDLVVIDRDSRQLVLLNSVGERVAYAAPSQILQARVADSNNMVTLELASKELHCFSLDRGELVAVFHASAGAES